MAAAKGKSKQPFIIVGAAVAVLIIGGISLFEMQNAKKEAAELAAVWTVTGAPCPTTTHAAAPPRRSEFSGVAFHRERASAVNCNTIQEDGASVPVCMFIGPGNLRIIEQTRSTDFAPSPGVDTTVYIRAGGPVCVQAINRAVF